MANRAQIDIPLDVQTRPRPNVGVSSESILKIELELVNRHHAEFMKRCFGEQAQQEK